MQAANCTIYRYYLSAMLQTELEVSWGPWVINSYVYCACYQTKLVVDRWLNSGRPIMYYLSYISLTGHQSLLKFRNRWAAGRQRRLKTFHTTKGTLYISKQCFISHGVHVKTIPNLSSQQRGHEAQNPAPLYMFGCIKLLGKTLNQLLVQFLVRGQLVQRRFQFAIQFANSSPLKSPSHDHPYACQQWHEGHHALATNPLYGRGNGKARFITWSPHLCGHQLNCHTTSFFNHRRQLCQGPIGLLGKIVPSYVIIADTNAATLSRRWLHAVNLVETPLCKYAGMIPF